MKYRVHVFLQFMIIAQCLTAWCFALHSHCAYADDDIIFVEAQTNISITTDEENGKIILAIFDDYNQLLNNKIIKLSFIERELKQNYEFNAVIDEYGSATLIPDIPQGEYDVTAVFDEADGYLASSRSFEFSPKILQDNVSLPKSHFSLVWFELIIGFVCLMLSGFIIYHLTKRKRKSPPPPQKLTAEVVRKTLPSNSPPEFVCVDSESGQPLDETLVKINLNREPVECVKWPFVCSKKSEISIEHPDYMPWNGKIRMGESLTIRLESRRTYAIHCFETAASALTKKHVHWGSDSPWMLKNIAVPEAKKPLVDEFVHRVYDATFDTSKISDELLDDIFNMSKKIV